MTEIGAHLAAGLARRTVFCIPLLNLGRAAPSVPGVVSCFSLFLPINDVG